MKTPRPLTAQEFREALMICGLKQSEFARYTGLSQAHVSRLANNREPLQPWHTTWLQLYLFRSSTLKYQPNSTFEPHPSQEDPR